MINILNGLEPINMVGILLSLIPALLSLGMAVYTSIYLHRNRLTNLLLLLLLCSLGWQFNDTFLRINQDLEPARIVDKILSTSWLLLMPITLHFALTYTGKERWLQSPVVLVMLYGPVMVFDTLYKLQHHVFAHHDLFGWIVQRNQNPTEKAAVIWAAALTMLTGIVLWDYTIRSRHKHILFRQSLFITVGFSVPLIQGVITEVIFPVVLNIPPLPLTSFSILVFVVGVIIALSRYQLFYLSKAIHTDKLINQMRHLILTFSLKKELTYINSFGSSLLGSVSFTGVGPSEGDLHDQGKMALRSLMDISDECIVQGPVKDRIIQLINAQGDPATLCISAEPIYINKKLEGVLIEGEDITKILSQNVELQRINRELDNIIYSASHDIRAPITTILGLLNLAEDGLQDKEQAEYLTMIRDCVNRLDTYTLDIIHYSRNTNSDLQCTEMDLGEHLQELLNNYRINHAGKVEMVLDINTTSSLYSDPSRVKTILSNLISNGIKYRDISKENQELHITATTNAKGAFIKVADNGLGIDPKHQQQIFEMFYRVGDRFSGSGLGLYIVKEMLNRLNGKIEIDSEPGKGTTFSLYLPNMPLTKN